VAEAVSRQDSVGERDDAARADWSQLEALTPGPTFLDINKNPGPHSSGFGISRGLWCRGSRACFSHPSQTTRRTPDFLLRGPSHGRVCGFL
jgi:hypothetical protein